MLFEIEIIAVASLVFSIPISQYFSNNELKPLMVYVAILPGLQNSISLLQIMFLSIGKAKQIAIRNLLVSIFKLIAIVFACYIFNSIAIMLFFQVITDLVQIMYFGIVLKKNNCSINIFRYDIQLVKEILSYCIPMAMFTVIKSLNRDCDKYIVSAFTDTETLAIYTNASKLLPFDIIMTSFCTVLLPYITRYISQNKFKITKKLYAAFLELSIVTTSIFAFGAICVAPELMIFLYTKKYISGISVFIVYIIVDVFSVLSITLILSAAGKVKQIMFVSIGSLTLNVILNFIFYTIFGIVGPALATLVVTLTQGMIIIYFAGSTIHVKITHMFDFKYILIFIIELILSGILSYFLKRFLYYEDISHIIVFPFTYCLFCLTLLGLNYKRVLKNLKIINECKLETVRNE